jgi:hypothetical protein
MGDIGPNRAHYDVLPVPEVSLDDADDWTVEPPLTAAARDRSEEPARPDDRVR